MCERKSIKSRLKRGINLEVIPTDVMMEIFSRLPSKSIARFRSVSKLWGSMLGSPYFNELFKTRSSARRRLLFVFQPVGDYASWVSYSSPQPQNPYEKSSSSSSLVVAADYHAKFSGMMRLDDTCSHAFGLVYFPYFSCTSYDHRLPMICNPITGQYLTLPKLDDRYRKWTSFLGFDPVDKQFKVLAAEVDPLSSEPSSVHGRGTGEHKILTLGTGKLRWRNSFHCPRYTRFSGEEICIDGVLYYLAEKADGDHMIVCFHVRSEKFKLMDVDCYYGKLINYKGKLGGIQLVNSCNNTTELRLWVLEDVEKHEWSKSVYAYKKVPDLVIFAGVTATGEIVLAMTIVYKQPFYVYYFHPERDTLQCIKIQGSGAFENGGIVDTFVDYAEDLSQSSLLHMHLRTSVPEISLRKWPKPQHWRDRDSNYYDGVSREKKHTEIRNERDSIYDEDIRRSRRRRRRRVAEISLRKWPKPQHRRDRDSNYYDGVSRETKHLSYGRRRRHRE